MPKGEYTEKDTAKLRKKKKGLNEVGTFILRPKRWGDSQKDLEKASQTKKRASVKYELGMIKDPEEGQMGLSAQ